MEEKEVKTITQILTVISNLELAAAELYRICSVLWESEREFWCSMEQAEVKHAQSIKKMKSLVLEKPLNFELGRPFKNAAIQTAVSGVKWNIERLKRNDISRDKMLFIARDLEQSIIEGNYSEMVRTADQEFRSLVHEIKADTLAHRESLTNRINQAYHA